MRNKSNHLKRIGVYLLAIMMVFTFLPVWQNESLGEQSPAAVYAGEETTIGPYTLNYDSSDRTCRIKKYSTTATTKELEIPKGFIINGKYHDVVDIWADAFRGNQYLTSVRIPSGATIADRAFADCPNLKTYYFTSFRSTATTVGAHSMGYTYFNPLLPLPIKGVRFVCPAESDVFKYLSYHWSRSDEWQWSRPEGDVFKDPSGYRYRIIDEDKQIVEAIGTSYSHTPGYAPGRWGVDADGKPFENSETTLGEVANIATMENGTSLRVDYKVTTIGDSDSPDTTFVRILKNITTIDKGALGSVSVQDGIILDNSEGMNTNRYFALEDGVLFDVNKTRLIRYAEVINNPTSFGSDRMQVRDTYTIPPSVKTIDWWAFDADSYNKLDTVYVGNATQGSQLEIIEFDAFSGAPQLKNIVFYSKNDVTIDNGLLIQALSDNPGFRVYAPKDCVIYAMQKYCEVTTVANDMPSLNVQVTGSSFAYDGKPHTPTVVIKNELGETLTSGVDYKLEYKTPFTQWSEQVPTKPGNYTLRISGKDKYYGSLNKSFTIVPTCKIKALWVSKHENSHVTFNWSGTPNNNLATGWDVQYRTKLIGTQYAWSKWNGSRADGKTLRKRVYLKPNYTIEFKVRHEGETAYCRSVFTTPAGGKYQSITQCRVKVVATASGAAYKQGTKTLTLKTGINFSGDTGNTIYIKKGTSIKITPNHVYPRSNYNKYPRLYPNHAWYDVTDSTVASLTGKASTAGMKDGAVTIKGLKAGTTKIKITSCNGRGATLTIVVK